jgi:hypothetical protein
VEVGVLEIVFDTFEYLIEDPEIHWKQEDGGKEDVGERKQTDLSKIYLDLYDSYRIWKVLSKTMYPVMRMRNFIIFFFDTTFLS